MSYTLSIVVPVFNEEALIAQLLARFSGLSQSLSERGVCEPTDVEVVFVNDGSSDDTYRLLREACLANPLFKLIHLSRNFGHQIAVSAGLDYATAHYVAIIDGDLQDPPELIADMLLKLKDGYDVVYGVRRSRKDESIFKRMTASAFYRVLRLMTSVDIPVDTGDFRVITKRVRDAICSMPEKHRFLRGMVSWVGFSQVGFEYDREARFAGTTKYPLSKMIAFALDGMTSFSTLPIKLIAKLGYMVVGLGIIYAIYVLISALFLGNTVEGWTSLILLVLVMGGVQLISLGVIGEYVGRNHIELKRRPLYFVQEIVTFRSK
jgi:glycosyltransferase involved in cell wall biosynthesis